MDYLLNLLQKCWIRLNWNTFFENQRDASFILEQTLSKSCKQKFYDCYKEKWLWDAQNVRWSYHTLLTQSRRKYNFSLSFLKNSTNLITESCFTSFKYRKTKCISSHNCTKKELWLSIVVEIHLFRVGEFSELFIFPIKAKLPN